MPGQHILFRLDNVYIYIYIYIYIYTKFKSKCVFRHMPALHFVRLPTTYISLCPIYFTSLHSPPVLQAFVTFVLFRFLFLSLGLAHR